MKQEKTMGFETIAGAKRLVLAASLAAAFGMNAAPALSADMETILEKMHEKGLLTDEEYEEMRTQAREERRREALEKANAEEKAAKAKEAEPATLKGKFSDGFTLESGDKQHAISLSGRVHADYRSFSPEEVGADTFDIRRAYLGVSGKLYNDWTFEVTGDLAADTLEYAFLNYKQSDALQFRIGAFKMPFSFEELTSSRFIDFQERSLVNALVPAKEQGLSIYGEPAKNVFAYAIAASNGQGKEGDDTSNTVDDKDLIGRLVLNLAPMMSLSNTIIHLGGNYSTGTIPVAAAPSGRTEGRGATFFIPAAFTGTEVDRERTGLEAVLAWGPVKLQTEWVTANFQGTSTGGVDYDRNIDAYYASVNWLITGEKYSDSYTLNGMRAIKPNNPFKKGAGGTGAWELGVRWSKWDGSEFAATNPAGTGALTTGCVATGGACTTEADAMTVALKWIPITPVRFYLNYVQTDFDTPVGVAPTTSDDEKAITLRAAVYF
jgi:phosphate-selective porin OprO/OprP